MQNNDQNSKRISRRSRGTFFNYPLAFFICTGAGVLAVLIAWLIVFLSDADPRTVLLASSITYVLVTVAAIVVLLISNKTASKHEIVLHRFDKMLDNMVFPYIITNSSGIIVKYNNAAKMLFEKTFIGIMPTLEDVLPFLTPEIIKRSASERVELQQKTDDDEDGVRHLIIESTETMIGDQRKTADPTKGYYYLTSIIDVTKAKKQLVSVARRLENETMVMGRIEIDDLKGFSMSSGISEKEASDKVREILIDWTMRQGGLLYEPETRKFIVMMPLSSLSRCIREKFPILDTVREALSTKDDEFTISMGFSVSGETLAERQRNADIAFEGRKSGNKAVVNTAGELTYFGRDRRRQITRGTSEYRRIGNTLRRLISESSSVLIMGHRRPDFDSIGSALGISKLAEDLRKNWHIVINDPEDENFVRLMGDISTREEYGWRFINETKAIASVRSDTLLIVTDVNSVSNMESPDLFRTVAEKTGGKTTIIDHHEKTDMTAPSDFEYIDTSCSSASEIVAGVLEISLQRTKLTSEEATVLLSGIMLDTKNFTQYTSGKTYAAAEFLSACSGSAERAQKFFEADSEIFAAEYSLGASVKLLSEGRIALCSGKGLADETKTKIVIGRLADRLLLMENVLATVVISEFDGRINASARSNNNLVNCAALFEGLGGGNFNNAGAFSDALSLSDFEDAVKSNIERFMRENVDERQEDSAEQAEDEADEF